MHFFEPPMAQSLSRAMTFTCATSLAVACAMVGALAVSANFVVSKRSIGVIDTELEGFSRALV